MTTDEITTNQHKEIFMKKKSQITFIAFGFIHIHGLFIRLCKMAVRHQ